MKKAKSLTKMEKIEIVLAMLGREEITVEQYRERMREQNITEEDVDQWCKEYHGA